MIGYLVYFLFILAAWGWTVLILWGVRIIVAQALRYFRKTNIQWRRLSLVAVLFLIAFGWQQVTARHNFGETYGTVVSTGGNNQVVICSSGSRRFALLVETPNHNLRFDISRPRYVFWMSSGTNVGLVLDQASRHIIDVELTARIYREERLFREEGLRNEYTPAQLERYNFRRRQLTPTECDEFDAELRQAEQRGLVWEMGK